MTHEYRVSIQVEADSPEDAAMFALEMLRHPEDHPTMFDVVRLSDGEAKVIDVTFGGPLHLARLAKGR